MMTNANRAYYRKCAVERAAAELNAGQDWQDVQRVLFENKLYSMLFPSVAGDEEISDEDAAESMAIIREAEESLGWR